MHSIFGSTDEEIGYWEEEVAEEAKSFIGKEIDYFFSDDENIKFQFSDGSILHLEVQGGCCSKSWIEHLTNIPDEHLPGSILVDILNSESVDVSDNKTLNPDVLKYSDYKDPEEESLYDHL